jgi:hypothetical protein
VKLSVLALDYDGTIANGDTIAPDVRAAIADVRTAGITVLLVTGRILDELRRVAGDLHFVDGVVAENGAVVHFPDGNHTSLLAPPVPDAFLAELDRRGIPATAGTYLVDTAASHAPRLLEVIRDLELPLVLLFNRSRVMTVMIATHRIRTGSGWLAGGLGLAAGAYLAHAAWTWLSYGQVRRVNTAAESDPLLDAFIPDYDVRERHRVRIAAPAAVTLAAAREMNLMQTAAARAVFKGRDTILGAVPDDRPRPTALLDLVQSLGWGVLAEVPGREVVVGAVTKPWEATPRFRPCPRRQSPTSTSPVT